MMDLWDKELKELMKCDASTAARWKHGEHSSIASPSLFSAAAPAAGEQTYESFGQEDFAQAGIFQPRDEVSPFSVLQNLQSNAEIVKSLLRECMEKMRVNGVREAYMLLCSALAAANSVSMDAELLNPTLRSTGVYRAPSIVVRPRDIHVQVQVSNQLSSQLSSQEYYRQERMRQQQQQEQIRQQQQEQIRQQEQLRQQKPSREEQIRQEKRQCVRNDQVDDDVLHMLPMTTANDVSPSSSDSDDYEELTLENLPKRGRKRARDSAMKPAPVCNCTLCGASESPHWRRGPAGGKTLCNACGICFGKELKALNGDVEAAGARALHLVTQKQQRRIKRLELRRAQLQMRRQNSL
jgi:GATA zinc finger